MRKYGPWTIKETNHIYQDPYVSLKVDQVIRPDGAPGQHVVVQIKAGVCVIAMDAQRRLHLTRGGIEPGEDPLSCARRELQEEVGLHANNWQHLTTVDPFTTIMQSPTRLYLATELSPVPQTLEGTEPIETVVMPIDQAVEAIESGLITHAPTCVAILLVNRRVKAV
jgi:ADP-ribose pyrophosphatase